MASVSHRARRRPWGPPASISAMMTAHQTMPQSPMALAANIRASRKEPHGRFSQWMKTASGPCRMAEFPLWGGRVRTAGAGCKPAE